MIKDNNNNKDILKKLIKSLIIIKNLLVLSLSYLISK